MILSNVSLKFSARHNQFYAYVGKICITFDFDFSDKLIPQSLDRPFSIEGVPYPASSDNIAFHMIVKSWSVS